MASLEAEKEMQGLADMPFWSGTLLFDGVIDRACYDPETVTIDARLVPKSGGEPIVLQTAGSRSALTVVADRLMERLRLALNKRRAEYEAKNAVHRLSLLCFSRKRRFAV